jgi:hypothetical protein
VLHGVNVLSSSVEQLCFVERMDRRVVPQKVVKIAIDVFQGAFKGGTLFFRRPDLVVQFRGHLH